jgi:D-alanyl-D-alanine carboxypeptidase
MPKKEVDNSETIQHVTVNKSATPPNPNTSNMQGVGRGDFKASWQGQSVDQLIMNYMEVHGVRGMSLALVQAPYITRVVGYGTASVEKKLLVGDNTLFPLGQMTNAYTAVAIMQLKEAEKLSLEDTLMSHISNVPKSWSDVRIFDLLTHSSGTPSYAGEDFDYSKEYTNSDIINRVKDMPLLFEAGTKQQYSATNHYLLGMVIEKVSGTTYQDYVQKGQIDPLKLTQTHFLSNSTAVENEVPNLQEPNFQHSQFKHKRVFISPTELADGYEINNIAAPVTSWSAVFADSGMVASARDVSLWDIGLAGDILIKEASNRKIIYGPVKLRKGDLVYMSTGWHFNGHPGFLDIRGHLPGYSTYLSRFTAPSDLLCVTLLANRGKLEGLDLLGRKIAGALGPAMGTPDVAKSVNIVQSPYSVAETIERLSQIIKSNGGKIFAEFDQAKEATNVGETLRPTKFLLFGNPKMGTALMKEAPEISIELPLRAASWKDSKGAVWLSYTDPGKLGREYGITDSKRLNAMSNNVMRAISKATGWQ